MRDVRQLARSRRPRLALFTNVLSSVGNLLLTVTVARTASTEGFGAFAVAFSVYLLATGLVRAAVAESVLGQADQGAGVVASGLREVSTLGLLTAGTLAAVAVVLGSEHLAHLALAVHGLLIYDYVKIVFMSLGAPRVALAQETAWTVSAGLVLLLSIWFDVEPGTAFFCWAASGAVLGYCSALRQGLVLLPQRLGGNRSVTSWSYALDHLAGSGIAQLSVYVLAGTAGPAVVGALRAAATPLSPLNLVISTSRSLAIPLLTRVRRRPGPSGELRTALLTTGLLLALLVPPAVGLVLLPDRVGEALLGASWASAQPLVPLLAVEVLLTVATTVAFAGHRARQVGGRTLAVRCGLAPVRLTLIVFGANAAGAAGAAWAMVAVAALGVVIWWASYVQLTRRVQLNGHDLQEPLIGQFPAGAAP